MFFRLFTALALVQSTLAIQPTSDIYYHEKQGLQLQRATWVFSSEGLSILSIDGSKTYKKLSKSEMDCGDSCFYFDIVTDGHKYVWANALHASPHRVDVFSLETGDYLGGVSTCNTPLDMDYVANREELWIRCAEPADLDDPKSGHMTVIQANSLSAVSEQVRLTEDRAYGYSVFHSSLGNYGYATANNVNVIWKVDMANRMTVSNFTLEKADSAYDMTYSPANKHLFIRSRVCCTCGFDGADAATCGRAPGRPGQNIQTGPNAGRTDLNGTCGVGCEGSPADTLGVFEFDTVSETFVANHQPKVGFGATPEASPDGRYIVLFANDGGQNLRVLRAGANGEGSRVAFDVALSFSNVPPGREAVSDFAFVQWKSHNLLAVASGYDNDLVLVDLSAEPPIVTKIKLSNSLSPTGGNGGRMVEWAYGSDYLWVDASDAQEAYVIRLSEDGEIAKAVVERTITNLPSSKIIYVENFAKRAQESFIREILTGSDPGDETQGATTSAQVERDAFLSSEEEPSVVAIVGLILGGVSLLANIVLIVFLLGKRNTATTNKVNRGNDINQTTESVTGRIQDEEKTLGSKQVA